VDEPLKRRLIGATVLVSLAIIFLPVLLSHKPVARHQGKMAPLPAEPERSFDASLLREIPAEEPQPAPAEPERQEPVAAEPATPVSKATPKPVPRLKSRPVAPPHIPAPETVQAKSRNADKTTAGGSPAAWVVRVGSFSSRSSADKLVKKLRKAGLDTMDPVAVTVKGKRYYRVQVGPQLDKKRAEHLLPRVNKIARTKGQVVRYP
jgi:DedD protein